MGPFRTDVSVRVRRNEGDYEFKKQSAERGPVVSVDAVVGADVVVVPEACNTL